MLTPRVITKEAKPRKRPDKRVVCPYLPEFGGSIQTIQKTKCMLKSPQNMQNTLNLILMMSNLTSNFPLRYFKLHQYTCPVFSSNSTSIKTRCFQFKHFHYCVICTKNYCFSYFFHSKKCNLISKYNIHQRRPFFLKVDLKVSTRKKNLTSEVE